jgi:hypothetical protein
LTAKNKERRLKKTDKEGGSDLQIYNSTSPSGANDVQKFIQKWEPKLIEWEKVMLRLEKCDFVDIEYEDGDKVDPEIPEYRGKKAVSGDAQIESAEAGAQR